MRTFARGRHKPGEMNKTEAAYAAVLEARKAAGEIAWYAFESVKLRLAPATFYTPDFMVMLRDGELQAHEVKGFMQDDAAIKLKVCAQTYPLRFLVVRQVAKKDGGGFTVKDVLEGL